jgi:hypothetical protein
MTLPQHSMPPAPRRHIGIAGLAARKHHGTSRDDTVSDRNMGNSAQIGSLR